MSQTMSETVRIGIVGTENSHVDQIIDYLNVSHPAAGARVVALAGGDTERNLQLSAVGGIRAVVDSVTDLIGSIDALIVTNRDGGLHREQAVPLLEAGVPVWVDKPLAVTVEDAEAIIEAAQRTRTPLTSYSALRWIPDTEALVERARDLGPLQSVCATGPADPASPWGGIFFYGIHPADVALRLAPGPLGPVRVGVERRDRDDQLPGWRDPRDPAAGEAGAGRPGAVSTSW